MKHLEISKRIDKFLSSSELEEEIDVLEENLEKRMDREMERGGDYDLLSEEGLEDEERNRLRYSSS